MHPKIYIFTFFIVLGSTENLLAYDNQSKKSEEIRGIVLIDSEEKLLRSNELQDVEGLNTERIDLPGPFETLQKELTPFYRDHPWNDQTIQAIKQQLYRYYQHEEHPFVLISIPHQDKKSQVIQFVVIESRMGKINIAGNTGVSSRRILNYFKTMPGERLNQRRLNKDLHFMNRDPFRRVNAIFSPGTEDHTTDVTLQVDTRRPYRFYTGVDNSGVLSTGRQRIFAGFNWDQVFGLDHSFFYQYTTNYNVQRFHANTFQYIALLPCELVVNLYGGFSIVHAHLPFPNRINHGTNGQGSIRLQIPLLPVRSFEQEISFGFDIKITNNTMEFVDFNPVFGHTVNLTQFMMGYNCKWESRIYIAESGAEIFFSPIEWLPNQSDADFATLRPGARNKWIRTTAFLSYKWFLPRSCELSINLSGQWSPQSLLPSEQLGLGGYQTVRGYDERQYNADSGFCAREELHCPSFSIFRSQSPNPDKMFFLLFLDAGVGVDTTSVPGIKRDNFLLGAGPGVRYSFGSYLTASCDWGIKLHNQADFAGGRSMIHFSVVGSF
ncbi:MAG: hypothetical protein HW387_7 [Parachlamydiales bacterium]|nr:hypothetical protein [Parachlamydiales bacterium]